MCCFINLNIVEFSFNLNIVEFLYLHVKEVKIDVLRY
jgi:hypothetical protein